MLLFSCLSERLCLFLCIFFCNALIFASTRVIVCVCNVCMGLCVEEKRACACVYVL